MGSVFIGISVSIDAARNLSIQVALPGVDRRYIYMTDSVVMEVALRLSFPAFGESASKMLLMREAS